MDWLSSFIGESQGDIMSDTTIFIGDLDPAEVLSALYNASKPQGMGFLQFDSTPMDVETARALLERNDNFDYLKGRVMKIQIAGDTLDPLGYDRDNGDGAAAQVIDSLRGTKDTNNVLVRSQHASATRASAQLVRDHLDEDLSITKRGNMDVFRLGLGDVADVLEPKVREAQENVRSPLDNNR